MIAPVSGLERDGTARGREGLSEAPRAHEQEREARVRFRQIALKLDRAAHVIDGAGEQPRVGLIARARHLVLPEARVAEADIGLCVSRIEDDRALESLEGARDGRRIERLEPDTRFGEGLVGLQAARLPVRPAWRFVRPRGAERVGKLRHDPILHLEHLLERAVGLRIRQRFTGCRVHDAGRDAQTIRGALKASDDGQVQMQLFSQHGEVRPDAADRFDDAHPIDDAERAGRAEVVGDGLGNPRRQPGELAIGAHVGEIEDRDGGHLAGGARGLDGRGARRLGGNGGLDRRNETVAAARDRLDVGRLRRIVAECLA